MDTSLPSPLALSQLSSSPSRVDAPALGVWDSDLVKRMSPLSPATPYKPLAPNTPIRVKILVYEEGFKAPEAESPMDPFRVLRDAHSSNKVATHQPVAQPPMSSGAATPGIVSELSYPTQYALPVETPATPIRALHKYNALRNALYSPAASSGEPEITPRSERFRAFMEETMPALRTPIKERTRSSRTDKSAEQDHRLDEPIKMLVNNPAHARGHSAKTKRTSTTDSLGKRQPRTATTVATRVTTHNVGRKASSTRTLAKPRATRPVTSEPTSRRRSPRLNSKHPTTSSTSPSIGLLISVAEIPSRSLVAPLLAASASSVPHDAGTVERATRKRKRNQK